MNTADLVGLAEIASRLNVTSAAAGNWVARGLLPKPALVANRVRLWDWPEVEDWAKATGRIEQGMQIGSRLDIYRVNRVGLRVPITAREAALLGIDSVSQ